MTPLFAADDAATRLSSVARLQLYHTIFLLVRPSILVLVGWFRGDGNDFRVIPGDADQNIATRASAHFSPKIGIDDWTSIAFLHLHCVQHIPFSDHFCFSTIVTGAVTITA
jgi:hypothetical protein